MSKIPFIITGAKSVTFVIDGVMHQAQADSVNLDAILDELRKPEPDPDTLIALVTPAQAIAKAIEAVADYLPKGVVGVTRTEVTYNGATVEGVLVERILGMLAEGFDIMPWVRFMENLYQNPADFAREELYLWLETSNLPITEDGCFLAYKKVNADFTSIHDGKTDNTPGKVVEMPRQKVDSNRHETCSRGLHFCSKDYLPNFGRAAGDVVVLLKINPADVVSIPSDYNNAKGRAWKYEVLQATDIDPQNHNWPSLVSATGDQYVAPDYSDDDEVDDDWNDDYDNFDPTSELGKALFAALNEIGLGDDRQARLNWAAKNLGAEYSDGFDVWSFNDLFNDEARRLLDAARAEKEEQDTKALAELETQKANVNQAEIDTIKSLGIIALRRKASKAGFKNAYKGPKRADLVEFLVAPLRG